MKATVVARVMFLCCCFSMRLEAEVSYLPDGHSISTQGGSSPQTSGARSVPYPHSTPVQSGKGQGPLQVVVPAAPSAAQLQGLLGEGTQKSSKPEATAGPISANAGNAINSQIFPQLTADQISQLTSVRDTASALLMDLSPVLQKGNNLRRTYDALNTILKPVPTDSPGQPLVQMAAMLDLAHIWRPESALNSVDPNLYSDVLRSLATSLNGISANIEKRNKTYGYMINGVDDRKIFMATLLDSKAASASAVPDSLVTRDVIQWYVENAVQFRGFIGEGPKIQKTWLFGDAVDRAELKTWCYNNREALKYYSYGRAILPNNLSYFDEK